MTSSANTITTAAPADSLRRRAFVASVWTAGGYGAGQVVRLASSIVLARLLVPEVFGEVVIANTVSQSLQMLFEMGVGQSIIRDPRGDEPNFLDTGWTLGVIRGIFLWLCAVLIAWPVARFYHNPMLFWYLVVASSSSVVLSLQSTKVLTLRRHLQAGMVTIFEIGSQILMALSILAWAWFQRGPWALVGGGLVGTGFRVLMSLFLPGRCNRLHWDGSIARDYFSFGRWIALSAVVQLIAMNSDRLILGRLLSSYSLGVYYVVAMWALAAKSLIAQLSASVVLPVMSQRASLPRTELRQRIISSRTPLLQIGALCLPLALTCSDLLIKLLYKKSFSQGAGLLPLLLLACWPTILSGTVSPVLLAIGRSVYAPVIDATRCVAVVAGIALGYWMWGLVGVVIGLAASEYIAYIPALWALHREGLDVIWQDLWATCGFVGCLVAFMLLRGLLAPGLWPRFVQ